MSTSVTDANQDANTTNAQSHEPTTSPSKGKGKQSERMDEGANNDEEDDDDEDEDAIEEDDSDVEETFEEIDPSAILATGRRTRGVKVDYASKEALEKAGLNPNQEDDDDDDDDDVKMKE